VASPEAIENLVNSEASSTDKPNLFCKVAKLAAVFSVRAAVVPKVLAKVSWAAVISLPVTPAILRAAWLALLTNCSAC